MTMPAHDEGRCIKNFETYYLLACNGFGVDC